MSRWRLVGALGPNTWRAADAGGTAGVVRTGPPPAVAAEAAALAALGPLGLPGLVADAGDGATVFVDGTPADRASLPTWHEVAAGLVPVAEALAAVHAAGWVHGDVSAANVVIGRRGRGVLVDLGCAAPAARARPTGTPGFAAPEVVAGARVTPAAEAWSLAATVLAAAPPAPPPPALAATLAAALATDPGGRPPVAALAAALSAAADPHAAVTVDYGRPPPAPPAAPFPPAAPARRAGRRAAVLAAAAVVVAACAAAGSSNSRAATTEDHRAPACDRVPAVPAR